MEAPFTVEDLGPGVAMAAQTRVISAAQASLTRLQFEEICTLAVSLPFGHELQLFMARECSFTTLWEGQRSKSLTEGHEI